MAGAQSLGMALVAREDARELRDQVLLQLETHPKDTALKEELARLEKKIADAEASFV